MKTLKELTLKEAKNMGPDRSHLDATLKYVGQHYVFNPKLKFTSEQLFKETLLFIKTKSQLIDIIVRMKKKYSDLYINNSDNFNLCQHYKDDEDDEDDDDDDENSDDYDDHNGEFEYDYNSSDYRDRLLREEENMYKKRKL
ncbi:hypothetical protein ACTFIZ_010351 [Dictyostelium cf. discoideum]